MNWRAGGQAYGVPPTESDRDAALAVLMMVGVVPELPRDHDELLTRIRAELMEGESQPCRAHRVNARPTRGPTACS
jgi:hypothetical protein